MAIAVKCSCGQQFAAQPHLYGKTLPCPSCNRPLTIPQPAAAMPITVACQCGQRFAAQPHLAGKQLACPSCGAPLRVPSHAPLPTTTAQAPRAALSSDPLGDVSAFVPATNYTLPRYTSNSQRVKPRRRFDWRLPAALGGGILTLLVVAIAGIVIARSLLAPRKWQADSVASEDLMPAQQFGHYDIQIPWGYKVSFTIVPNGPGDYRISWDREEGPRNLEHDIELRVFHADPNASSLEEVAKRMRARNAKFENITNDTTQIGALNGMPCVYHTLEFREPDSGRVLYGSGYFLVDDPRIVILDASASKPAGSAEYEKIQSCLRSLTRHEGEPDFSNAVIPQS